MPPRLDPFPLPERLGWDIMRFWVYEVREDLAGSVGRVKAWMNKQGVATPS